MGQIHGESNFDDATAGTGVTIRYGGSNTNRLLGVLLGAVAPDGWLTKLVLLVTLALAWARWTSLPSVAT